MRLKRVTAENVRNLHAVTMEPAGGLNVIVGKNGSGKTSLLEAIHLIGVGRSFRSRRGKDVVREGETRLVVSGEVDGEFGLHRLGVAKGRKEEENAIRIDGQKGGNASALAHLLPIQVISPETHELIDGGPPRRRAFVDWGLFHVEPGFHRVWLEYQRALKQRNAALRSRSGKADPWSVVVARWGSELDQLRTGYVTALRGATAGTLEDLLPGAAISIEYQRGWSPGQTLEEALAATEARDWDRGFTGVGPHRADIVIRTGVREIRETLSRGQKKLAMYALKLGQVMLLRAQREVGAVVLLDDLAAELDPERRGWLLAVLKGLGLQAFVTGTESAPLLDNEWPDSRVFHVEQGRVYKVV